jgi:ABC-type sulfate transport system substrate-binding protein
MVQSLTVDNIVKYGKANGYSPKQIQSVINGTKNDLVTHGINS